MTLAALLLWVLTGPVGAPTDDAGVDAANQALDSLARTHQKTERLRAKYTQERSSLLTRKPIVSQGELCFRRDPGCLIFRTKTPSPTVIRLDAKLYEVHRPQKKQLERFPLEGQDWPRALFDTFSHQVEEIRRRFVIVGSELQEEGKPEEVRWIHLKPRDPEVGKKMTALYLGIRSSDALLTKIAYADAQGDRVEIRLEKIEPGAELPASAFELKVPSGTRIIQHDPKKPK